jgi:cholesterol transport system auxiliary component
VVISIRRRQLLLVGLSAMAACGLLPLPNVQQPTKLYTLSPKTRFPSNLPTVHWQLVVNLPTAAAGIDSSRIALTHNPFRLENFSDAAWTDTAPGMVQSLLIESFERTKKILAVGPESAGLRPDYILETDLREFQVNCRGSESIPTAVVRIDGRLLAMPERRIIGATTSQKLQKARGTNFEDVLVAFNDALGHVLRDIVVFALTTPPAS